MKVDEILAALTAMFPDAHCELNHRNPFELAVAVVLSAQTTDVSVNKVTPRLFEKYPTPQALAEAPLEDIEDCIRRIGLYHNKAKSIRLYSQFHMNQNLSRFQGNNNHGTKRKQRIPRPPK